MKAFSLWQPWASLWCSRCKRDETRGAGSHFDRTFRGWLAVHATKKFVRDFAEGDPLHDILDSEFGGHWGMDLPTGGIIGAVKVVAVKRTDDMYSDGVPEAEQDNHACGDFSPGRFAIERSAYVTLPNLIPFRGQQGRYFDIPDFPDLMAAIAAKDAP